MKRLIDLRAWAIILSAALFWASLEHPRWARAVTVRVCMGEACTVLCDGSLSTPAGEHLTYRIHCKDTIFTDGFE